MKEKLLVFIGAFILEAFSIALILFCFFVMLFGFVKMLRAFGVAI